MRIYLNPNIWTVKLNTNELTVKIKRWGLWEWDKKPILCNL